MRMEVTFGSKLPRALRSLTRHPVVECLSGISGAVKKMSTSRSSNHTKTWTAPGFMDTLVCLGSRGGSKWGYRARVLARRKFRPGHAFSGKALQLERASATEVCSDRSVGCEVVRLTIAIPTFERRETVLRCVAQVLEVIDGLPVGILVADNASQDGTVDALRRAFGHPSVRVIKGECNLGLKGNVERLLNECESEYLLLLSDEDDLASHSVLAQLLELLDRLEPGAVLPSKIDGDRAGDAVPASDLWDASMYLSGIVLRVSSGLTALRRLDAVRKNADVDAILIWPQYVVVLDAFLAGEVCCWAGYALSRKREELPTSIADESRLQSRNRTPDRMRGSYKSIEARLAQASAILSFIDADGRRSGVANDSATDARVQQARRVVEKKIFTQLRGRLAYDFPQLLNAFDRGSRTALAVQGLRAPASIVRRIIVCCRRCRTPT